VKVVLSTNIIAPYRKPLFEEIGKHFDLTIICSSVTEVDREWQAWDRQETFIFKSIILKGITLKMKRGFFYFQTGLVPTLREIKPEILINSSFNLNTLWGSLYAKIVHIPSLIWSEATCFSERDQSFARHWFRRLLIYLNDAYIPSGIDAKEFLLSLGATEDRCFTAVDAVEDIRKSPEYESIIEKVNRLRTLKSDLIVLFSGQLILRKGIDLLFAAYEKIQDCRSISLWIMGSGPLEKTLKEAVVRKGLKNVKFLGYMQEREKWFYYLLSDIFVLPTREDVWGLVVNEAMMCGLPVICSKNAGCCNDLIEDGKTGYRIDPCETEKLSDTLHNLIMDDSLRKTMSKNALEKVRKYNIEESTKGFLRAISFCKSKRKIDGSD
jgi:glycosyltransferase involved in cell wall biosynthesis